MKMLFVCTSNKDRSKALELYFSAAYPEHEFASAGVNKYFTEKYSVTHFSKLLTQDLIDWADLVVYAEKIHFDVTTNKLHLNPYGQHQAHTYGPIILEYGEFNESTKEDYLTKADLYLSNYFK